MRKPSEILIWVGAGVVGGALLVWLLPTVFPFVPQNWQVTKGEATAIALERFRDLGEPVEDPYVVTTLTPSPNLERRLILALEGVELSRLQQSTLADRVLGWVITVYPPGAASREWSHRARVSTRGEVTALELRLPPEAAGGTLEEEEARSLAAQFLEEQGLDLARLDEPTLRRKDLAALTDLSLRYRDREAVLGEGRPYGVEVSFAGDRLTGFSSWFEDPEEEQVEASMRLRDLAYVGWTYVIFPLLPVVGVPFLRRYHEGLVGVARGLQIFGLVMVSCAVLLLLTARGTTEGTVLGPLTRQQVNWVWSSVMLVVYFPAVALLAFFGWSVGESLCRERWGHKLAAFDALFQVRWDNVTVAASALRGVVSGVALSALLVAAMVPLGKLGAWCQVSFVLGPWWADARWPGIALLAVVSIFTLSHGLFGRLFLLPPAVRFLGPWVGGSLVALVTGVILSPPLFVLPLTWGLPLWIAGAGILVVLFLVYDLLTTLLAALVSHVLLGAFPLLFAQDPGLELQGWVALVGATLPLWVSLRSLGSDRVFTYRYDDIPPHVRRIADREHQRVELETARRIQSSILPNLPSRLANVEIAHTYRPATEVGGDFYDVRALEDGRLAVAIGDVAGHGVSSGLIMAMARSALAVQVTFKPEVEEVFTTLNRVVFESAQKRLLTTLCYALLDPEHGELVYASAGHPFPYQVSREGRVVALESVAYPLGVRERLEIRPRRTRLGRGDSLFLSSDGLVEARSDGELFGFRRLEESLARHAGQGAPQLRDGVLRDLQAFTGGQAQEDDLTVLVLTLP